MTVVSRGRNVGNLAVVTRETTLGDGIPDVEIKISQGIINADLTIGADVKTAKSLRSNERLSSPGLKLHGAGFIVTPGKANELGLQKNPDLENYIRPYLNGRDLTQKSRNLMVIDLFGLSENEVRSRFPAVYQHVLLHVKPERDQNSILDYRQRWWQFAVPRQGLRAALDGLDRYIVTVETSKHRIFTFLPKTVAPDNKLIVIAADDAYILGVLSSSIHLVWALERFPS